MILVWLVFYGCLGTDFLLVITKLEELHNVINLEWKVWLFSMIMTYGIDARAE